MTPNTDGQPTDAPAFAEQSSSSTEKKKILVVDDYADNAEMYSEYFMFAGYEVATAADGQQAIHAAMEGNPDVILMDLSLPIVSGWEAIRRLKNDPRTANIPILALTGHAMKNHMERASDAGADDFAAKPCLPMDVEEKVRQLLSLSPREVKQDG